MHFGGVCKSLLLKVICFSLVQDMEQFYELWLKSQKNEKSDDVASQSNKENGKQIHMPTDYAEVTVSAPPSACGHSASPSLASLLMGPFLSLPFPQAGLPGCLPPPISPLPSSDLGPLA